MSYGKTILYDLRLPIEFAAGILNLAYLLLYGSVGTYTIVGYTRSCDQPFCFITIHTANCSGSHAILHVHAAFTATIYLQDGSK